jgi:hypothetical protein
MVRKPQTVERSVELDILAETGELVNNPSFNVENIGQIGVDANDVFAYDIVAILHDYFPVDSLDRGDEWSITRIDTIRPVYGGTIVVDVTKKYRLRSVKKGIAKVLVELDIAVDQSGDVRTKTGEQFELVNKGKGDGNGKIEFDIERGVTESSSYDWMIEFDCTFRDKATDGKVDFEYYAERSERMELQK